MKKPLIRRLVIYLLLINIVGNLPANNIVKSNDLTVKIIDECLERSVAHSKNMSLQLENTNALPRTIDNAGKLITSNAAWWTSGFYPGVLWYLYEYSNDTKMKELAQKYSSLIENEKHSTSNHDLGFMLYCSFGNGLRLTHNKQYEEILTTGAKSLMRRYNSRIGSIKSWDFNKHIWQFPVIIDNMMNLELVFWASKELNDKAMYQNAVNHADKTMNYHFRPDYSCYHVVSYDTITGLPHIKQTHQGLNDSSAWARGQAWALYGFTMTYRFTNEKRFLNQAINIAKYIINHPNMPTDKIPLWDFNAKKNDVRDASAAAIISSALIELSEYTPRYRSQFMTFAKEQLLFLSSGHYFAKENTNGNFILMHSTGNMPSGDEIDKPLSYADYYYIEALLRYKKQLTKKQQTTKE